MAGISYYGQDLDIDNFGWHRLLWSEFGHQQLWAKAAIMAGVGPTTGTKPLWVFFFFFQQERIEWVIFADRENNGSTACNLDKERLTWVWEEK
jgi:hypothetical protein